MAVDVEVHGDPLLRLSRALREEADGRRITRELGRGLRAAAGPAMRQARANILATDSAGVSRGSGRMDRYEHALSRARGMSESARKAAARKRGLRAAIAAALTVRVRLTARTAVVQVSVRGASLPPDQRQLPRNMDRGKWAHPLFGRRSTTIMQTTTPPGWFRRAKESAAPQARVEALAAMDRAVAQMERRIGG
ncbi:MAG: hypothetical protein ACRCZP_07715 [Phycicoccus sp.]